jgi:hypothetical protein
MGREIERPQPSASLPAEEDQGRECGNAVPGATVAPSLFAANLGRSGEVERLRSEDQSNAGSLPCLFSNNSTEPVPNSSLRLPSGQHRKSATALAWNVQSLVERHGLCSVGFFTLTFADLVLSPREAQRRFNSLATHVLRPRYPAFVRVLERQRSGRLHHHVLLALPFDARTGVDFEAFGRGDYRSAPAELRSEWVFWRLTAKKYGFGRTELLPVKSTAEGIGRYVGKYIGKHVSQREERDRGVRLVEYSRGARMATTKFAWVSDNAASWRRKVEVFACMVAAQRRLDHIEFEDLSKYLGSGWAYHHRTFIAGLPDPGG